MHLRKGNSAIGVTKSYERDWNNCLWNSDSFTAYDRAWLGVSSTEGHGKQHEDNMKIDTSPADNDTRKKRRAIDLRDDPVAGGEGYGDR